MTDTPDAPPHMASGIDVPAHVLAIVGPTGVGKSALAESLAALLDGEIISADSMQVYRGMDIGTAKTPPDRRAVPHHCIDLVSPGDPYSAARYQADARAAIADVVNRGHTPILVGGTGLYVRAALDDLHFPAGEAITPLRAKLEQEADLLGGRVLHERLAALDPASAALIHPNNIRRTVRALEMAEEGTSYAEQASGFARRQSIYAATLVGLTMQRDVLYGRIDARVDHMMNAGLLDEVRDLLEAGFREAITAAAAIGYKELVPVLEYGADLDQAICAIKQASRRYAKRQLSWFNADPRIEWIDVTDVSSQDVLPQALRLVESGRSAGTGQADAMAGTDGPPTVPDEGV